MMSVVTGTIITVTLVLWMQVGIVRCCKRTPALHRHLHALSVIALLWFSVAVAKTLLPDVIFTPPDAADHEQLGRGVAQILVEGRFADALELFGMGNTGFQFLLGLFYAATDAPQFCVIAIFGALAFMGLLSTLEVVCRHADNPQVPLWLVVLICAMPSALFYSTTNLKEGMVLWGGCMMLRYTLRYRQSQPRESLLLPAIGLLLTGFLRAHIAIAWVAAISVGGMSSRRKLSGVVIAGICLVSAQSVVALYRPDLTQKIMDQGVTETMNGFYENNSTRYGGSTISYHGGRPTPVVSGLLLLFLRPLPGDIFNIASFAAGVEVWCLSIAVLVAWWKARNRIELASAPFTTTLLTAALIFGFYFTYMYNMGLMVRQRTQVIPMLVGLVAVPAVVCRRKYNPLLTGSATAQLLPKLAVPQRAFPAARSRSNGQ